MSEVVVVGGGLAGAAAATLLAQAGRKVLLLERETGAHDKICGEFVSTEAQAHLRALGFDAAALGGAPINRVRLSAGQRSIAARLPFTALGLTRRRLDAALLDHAERAGAKVERGVSARSHEGGLLATNAGELRPATCLLATGKHDLRGAKRASDGLATDLIGFKQYFRVDAATRAALAGWIEVTLFEGGYAGLQLVEDGIVNLCLLVQRDRFAALGRQWETLFDALMDEPQIALRLRHAEPLLARPLTISAVPYGFLHDANAAPGDLFRLGDQAGVIPSFTGDGMSIALHSARLAALAINAGGDAAAYHRQLRRDIACPVRLAHRLQRIGFTRAGQRALLGLLGVWPATLGRLAAATRVPEPALRRAGLAA